MRRRIRAVATTSSLFSTVCTTWRIRPAPPVTRGRRLIPIGTACLVEPFAGDSLSDNLNPVGRVFYGASSLICVPVSLAQQGPALGAQAGEQRLTKVMVNDGGFTRFRRAAETPFNLVFEARP